MQRVLAVELLHLLAAEGAYGGQAAAALDASEVWAAYRDQRHDLFLPAGGTAQVRFASCMPPSRPKGAPPGCRLAARTAAPLPPWPSAAACPRMHSARASAHAA